MTADYGQRAAELFSLPDEEWASLVASEIAKSQESRAFDIDEALGHARKLSEGEIRQFRKRNKLAALAHLRSAARQGLRVEDPVSEALLSKFRRDALREAGVDERLVRLLLQMEAA